MLSHNFNNQNNKNNVSLIIEEGAELMLRGFATGNIAKILIAAFIVPLVTLFRIFENTCLSSHEEYTLTNTKETPLREVFNNTFKNPITMREWHHDSNSILQAYEIARENQEYEPLSNKKLDTSAFITLRDYLLLNNFTLKATFIKKVSHSINEEDIQEYLESGKLQKPCWTEYIDFSQEINESLKKVFPNKVKLRKISSLEYPCVALENGDTIGLTEDLQRVFLNNEIKITFTKGGI